MSRSTVWCLLDSDALKPWQHRTWLFPRDPDFATTAGRVLDLYQGQWDGQPLHPADCILSADEKTSIQARVRCHTTTPTRSGRAMRVEHEYGRGGALAYLGDGSQDSRFKDPGHAQRFLAASGPITARCRPRRPRLTAAAYREIPAERFAAGRASTGTPALA